MTQPTLIHKLSPRRFPGMSGKMAAIVGYVMGEDMTTPAFHEMVVTSDGYVLAGVRGDVGCNEFLGTEADLRANWTGLLAAAGLSKEERHAAETLYATRIRHFG